MHELEKQLYEFEDNPSREVILNYFSIFCKELESGSIRAAEKNENTWKVNLWVKKTIMLGFKYGVLTDMSKGKHLYFDKDTLPLQNIDLSKNIRIVPGGTSIRSGSYVASGTIIMPPAYINIGAFIDSGCMIDSHALVGSCAQVGKNVHLSAASQIGGVLEPIGALPVIIEDNVFIGGNCGIYEGTIVQTNAVIGTGVILNASTPVFDSVYGKFIRKTPESPLTVPAGAVVVAGSRPMKDGNGAENGIHLYCPVIIKYRDEKTNKAVTLEELLR